MTFRWPWQVNDESDATDVVVSAIQAAANRALRTPAHPASCSVVQGVTDLMGRAFAGAQVDGAPNADITPAFLIQAGRAAVLAGEFFARVEVTDRIRFTITTVDEVLENGSYRLNLPRPDGDVGKVVDDDPLRCLYRPISPYRGSPPWHGTAAGALAALEASVASEANSTPNARIFTGISSQDRQVAGEIDADFDAWKRELEAGGVVKVGSQSMGPEGHLAQGTSFPNTASNPESMGRRIGYDGSNPTPTTIGALAALVAVQLGFPPAMVYSQQSGSQTLQAGYRFFISTAAEPYLATLAAELSRVLGSEVTLSLPQLKQSDIQARSRAFGLLVNGGLDVERALRIVGLDD